MGAAIDIYNLPKKIEYYKRRISQDTEITEENKKAIFDFFENCYATGLSQVRVLFYAQRLYPMAKWLKKNFKDATKEDIEALALKIERNENLNAGGKSIYKVSLKKFYKWLEGGNIDYPDKVRWLKTNVKTSDKILPEQLLNLEDIRKLIDSAENPRDKALIATLYESGTRVGEIAGLKLKDISFDENGAVINVTGKTGPRRVRLLFAVNYLTTWLEHHPDKNNSDSPLWVKLTRNKEMGFMNYATIRIQVQKIAKRAKVNKKISLHGFRHARATELARLGLSQFQMERYLGWTHGSDMPKTYLHLSGKDVDDAILGIYGKQTTQNNKQYLQCLRCKKDNEVDSKFCSKCSLPLSTSAAINADETKEQMVENMKKIMVFLGQKFPEFQKQQTNL